MPILNDNIYLFLIFRSIVYYFISYIFYLILFTSSYLIIWFIYSVFLLYYSYARDLHSFFVEFFIIINFIISFLLRLILWITYFSYWSLFDLLSPISFFAIGYLLFNFNFSFNFVGLDFYYNWFIKYFPLIINN